MRWIIWFLQYALQIMRSLEEKIKKIGCRLVRVFCFYISKLQGVLFCSVSITVCRRDKMVLHFGKRFFDSSDLMYNVVCKVPKGFISEYRMHYRELLFFSGTSKASQSCLNLRLTESKIGPSYGSLYWSCTVQLILRKSRLKFLVCCEYVWFVPNGDVDVLALVPVVEISDNKRSSFRSPVPLPHCIFFP